MDNPVPILVKFYLIVPHDGIEVMTPIPWRTGQMHQSPDDGEECGRWPRANPI